MNIPVDEVPSAVADDPVVSSVVDHLRRSPLPPDRRALLLRWTLGRRRGEVSTPEVAAMVVDVKRTYLEMRASLRRVYAALDHWDQVGPVLRVMGFEPLGETIVGDRRHLVAVLDFGPGGVDGWIGDHVLAEQGEPSAVSRPSREVERAPLFALTPREREVLALLAQGMTNARLAETLFISERTANRHVSNIFIKLGVRNRTQAARVAMDAGLSA